MILAIDPGRDKCGVVVMSESGEIKFQKVIETINFSTTILELEKDFDLRIVILGNGTTSKELKLTIEKIISIPIKVVDEKHTTEEARKLYWIKNPPQGWRKLLPTTMQVPPMPVDDLVAEILAKRFLSI
ncbi:MAG: pre-16S rRNA-processing nuclease YqgF [Selenomonadaceae bacterium]|nr:pre-16S rRNA-processing nuclease YqgF [Selenomonadaceae bacterium]